MAPPQRVPALPACVVKEAHPSHHCQNMLHHSVLLGWLERCHSACAASSHGLALCRAAKTAAQLPPSDTNEQRPGNDTLKQLAEASTPSVNIVNKEAEDAAAVAAQQAAHKADLHRLRALKEGVRADLAAQRQLRKPAAPPVSSPPTSHTSACMDVVEAQAAWRITCLPLTRKPGRWLGAGPVSK